MYQNICYAANTKLINVEHYNHIYFNNYKSLKVYSNNIKTNFIFSIYPFIKIQPVHVGRLNKLINKCK